MRWLLLALTVFIFVLALRSGSPGWMAFGLLSGIVMCFVTVLAFAAKRIESKSQSEVYVPTAEELALLKRRAERQKRKHEMRSGSAVTTQVRPPGTRLDT
jgi:hypothetical protein